MPQILIVGALSVAVVLCHQLWPKVLPAFSSAPFALLGIAISIFLNFRNSACYDRWWEARRHWGELILFSRNLARQTLTLPDESREHLLKLACAFAHALVHHLRPAADETQRVVQYLTPDEAAQWRTSRFPPDRLTRRMGEELAALRRSGVISDMLFHTLDQTIGEMTMVQTACERIQTTPVPFGYTLLLHRTAYLFCFLLPFGFADTLGWATPVAAILVAHLLRPGRLGRRTGRAVRPARQQPAPGSVGPNDRTHPARGAGRKRSARTAATAKQCLELRAQSHKVEATFERPASSVPAALSYRNGNDQHGLVRGFAASLFGLVLASAAHARRRPEPGSTPLPPSWGTASRSSTITRRPAVACRRRPVSRPRSVDLARYRARPAPGSSMSACPRS